MVEQAKIGATQPVEILRDGKRMTLNVMPAEQPASYGLARSESRGSERSEKSESSRVQKLGIEVETLTSEVADRLDLKEKQGVVITDVESGGPADRAGLASGMVITRVNRKPVNSAEDFRTAIEHGSLEKGVLLLVHSQQGTRFVVLRVEE